MRTLTDKEISEVNGAALPLAVGATIGLGVALGSATGALSFHSAGRSAWTGAAVGGLSTLLAGVGGALLTSGVAGTAVAGTTLTGVGAAISATAAVATGEGSGDTDPSNAGS